MATIKAIHGGKSLKSAIGYVTNPDKAEVINGINCNAETALEEMEVTKNMYGKTGGRTYIHLVQSFHQDEDFFSDEDKEKLKDISEEEILKVKAQKVNEIGQKLIKDLPLFKGHEVVIATHIDRNHIHNHFIANSVNYENGYKFQSSARDLQKIKDKSDEICREYGLTITEKGKTFYGKERDETSTYTKEARWVQVQAEKRVELPKKIEELKQGETEKAKIAEQILQSLQPSYIRNIALNVLKARDKAKSKEEFVKVLAKNNISVVWSDTRKNITFIDLDREKRKEKKCKVRDKTLNQYFDLNITKDTLEKCFASHKSFIDVNITKDISERMQRINTLKKQQAKDVQNEKLVNLLSLCNPFKYTKNEIKSVLPMLKCIANKDFKGAVANICEGKATAYMKCVVNCHGTDTKTIHTAMDAITSRNTTPAPAIINGTLQSNEYRQATSHKGQGIWSKIIDKITGKDDKWVSADIPKIKEDWLDDWNLLSETEKADRIANQPMDRY